MCCYKITLKSTLFYENQLTIKKNQCIILCIEIFNNFQLVKKYSGGKYNEKMSEMQSDS